jgi:hypothetical protein
MYLREFIRKVLNERSGMGTYLAGLEVAAKLAYDAAQETLKVWEGEDVKRQAFFAKCKELGIKASSAVADKLRRTPEYSWNVKMIQKQKSTLVKEVQKTRAEYARYVAEAEDMASVPKLKKSEPEGRMPAADKKVYLSPGEMKPLVPYRWDDPKWYKAIKKIPLGFSEKATDTSAAALTNNPGEARLAVIFGAEQQGGSVSFDLRDQQGRRWECKGLKGPSDTIRPGTLGIIASETAVRNMVALLNQILNFTKEIKRVGLQNVATTPEQVKRVHVIENFITTEYDAIVKAGEISTERFTHITRCLRTLGALKKEWNEGVSEKGPEQVAIAGKTIAVPRENFPGLARKLTKISPESALINTIDARERCLSWLTGNSKTTLAYDDYTQWLDDWDESIDVRKIFKDVDGVMIINPDGFTKIPKNMLSQVLTLARFSAGVPRYAFSGRNIQPLAKKKPP